MCILPSSNRPAAWDPALWFRARNSYGNRANGLGNGRKVHVQ